VRDRVTPFSPLSVPLLDEEKKPLRLSRQLASLTCGIFFPLPAQGKSLILLDPSTFEGDYNDCTRQFTQREAVVDHLLTLITDTEGNITFLSQVLSICLSPSLSLSLSPSLCLSLSLILLDPSPSPEVKLWRKVSWFVCGIILGGLCFVSGEVQAASIPSSHSLESSSLSMNTNQSSCLVLTTLPTSTRFSRLVNQSVVVVFSA
jgi:hypothetical protein